MLDFVAQANDLKREGTDLLQESGLVAILERYGAVSITGSFSYDLMTWRDIDVCLEVDQVDLPAVFQLGRELASLPHVGSLYFRNEFVLRTPGNPTAVFWCIEFVLPNEVQWKVDVLISTSDHVKPIVDRGEGLKARLNAWEREKVLEIKGALSLHPEHRKEVSSTDIYAAVLDHGVASLEEWNAWRRTKPNVAQSHMLPNDGG